MANPLNGGCRDQMISLSVQAFTDLKSHTLRCQPFEACGILTGPDCNHLQQFIPVTNTAAQPRHHFTLDPAAWTSLLMKKAPMQALYHSHPSSPPLPSIEDLQQLQNFGGLFSSYLIGSPAASPTSELPGLEPDLGLELSVYRLTQSRHDQAAAGRSLWSLTAAGLLIT